MPSGKQHLQFELSLLPFLIGAYFVIDPNLNRTLVFGLAYLAGSFLMSPDLDLRHNSSRRNWGLLGIVWLPYSTLFKHRGISHHPLFGTATRVGYLLVCGYGLFLMLSFWNWHLPTLEWSTDWTHWGVAGLGLYLSNALHVVLDRIVSALRWRSFQ